MINSLLEIINENQIVCILNEKTGEYMLTDDVEVFHNPDSEVSLEIFKDHFGVDFKDKKILPLDKWDSEKLSELFDLLLSREFDYDYSSEIGVNSYNLLKMLSEEQKIEYFTNLILETFRC